MKRMILAMILIIGIAMPAKAADFELNTDNHVIEAGQQITITVTLDESLTHENNFRNCQGEIYYDPDVLTYVSHTMGAGYEDFDSAHIQSRQRVQFSKTAMNSSGYESIPAGTVITVVFRAKETVLESDLVSVINLKIGMMPVGMDTVQTNTSVSITICAEQSEKDAGEVEPEETVTIAEMGDVIMITTNSEEPISVTVPVDDASHGDVIVVLNEDGTETVVANSKMTRSGLSFVCSNHAVIKIVDRAKTFDDVNDGSWYNNAVDYVSARGIMNGMTESQFAPGGATTRAQVWTMLARLSDIDTTCNEGNWYDIARAWAMENGISDGTDANGKITREQLVTMLYRFVGENGKRKSIDGFSDAANASDWARLALEWAYAMGIMNGNDDGTLDPKGDATRGQLAQFFMNFIQNT